MTPLEQLIRDRALSPIKIARAADVTPRYLHLVRSGQVEPSVSRAIRIARAIQQLTKKKIGVTDLWAA